MFSMAWPSYFVWHSIMTVNLIQNPLVLDPSRYEHVVVELFSEEFYPLI